MRACARLQRIIRTNSSSSMSLLFRYLNGVAAESSSAAHVDRPAFLHVEDATVGLLRLLKNVMKEEKKTSSREGLFWVHVKSILLLEARSFVLLRLC